MVWHAFLLNPHSFKTWCSDRGLTRLRQIPFPWKLIHTAITTFTITADVPPYESTFTFTSPPSAAEQFQQIFNLAPDLLAYLTSLPVALGTSDLSDPLLRATTRFGSDTLTPMRLDPFRRRLHALRPDAIQDHAFMDLLYACSQQKPQHRPLADNVVRQAAFVDKMHRQLWIRSPALEGTLRRARERYEEFLGLFKAYPGEMLVPTLDIDLVWHTHQLGAARYERDMLVAGGSYIDHDDKIGRGHLRRGSERTKELWSIRVGGEYEGCNCWDCEAVVTALEEDQEIDVEEVVKKVAREVEYYRVVEMTRRRGWGMLPVVLEEKKGKT
ncbi:hypothetical protein VTI74DRAFT_6811 [Chaetomium olivicolor]